MKKILFTILALSTFLMYDNVFAINEEYFDSLTYDEVSKTGDKNNSNYNNENKNFSKVLSIHSFEGPFYSFDYHSGWGNNASRAQYYKFDLTKEFDSIFDTDLLIEYDKLYYLELIYYTKDKQLTNIDYENNVVNAPNNYSFITNDFQTYYDHYEVFQADRDLFHNEFYSSTHLNTYVTYGRTQCKIADSNNYVYKCRVTYQINPNVFHKSTDNPNGEVKGAELVFDIDNILVYDYSFIAISELGWHSEVAGTDDMIPEIEDFPFQEFDPDGDKTVLDYIKDMFTSIISLPINIGKAILDILQTLFIPSDDYFETNFNILRDLMELKLGFLYYPISLIEDFYDYVVNIPDTQHALFEISKVELMGYTLIPSMSIDLLDIVNSNDNFKHIYEIYRTFTSGMIVLWLVQLAIQKEKEFMGGGR